MRRYPPFDGDIEMGDFHLPAPPRGFWVGVVGVLILLFLLFVAGPSLTIYTDLKWFQALGLGDVFTTRLGFELGLFFGSLLAAFVFLTVNVVIALRLREASVLRTIGIHRRFIRTIPGYVGLGVALLLSVAFSAGAASQWQQLVLFLNGGSTGITEPVFNQDLGFYLFTLPFMHTALGWALGLVFLTALLVAGLYAWRGTDIDLRLPVRGISHVSLLLAITAALVGAGAFVGRYDLLSQHNGYIWGAGYTDVNVRVPIIWVQVVVAAILVVALLANSVLRRIWLPVVALAIWIVVGIVGAVIASGVERLTVAPNQYSQEEPYIARELASTRQAFGLDTVTTTEYPGTATLTQKDVTDDRTTIDNLRLWDYRQLGETYPQLQAIRTYYSLNHIAIDRYRIDGKLTQLDLSARELDTAKLPDQSKGFVNQKLTYTHGYGVVASAVNAVDANGLPVLLAHDIPPQGALKIDKPAIYFGQETSNYVLAPSAQPEFDRPQGNTDAFASYTGTHSPLLTGLDKIAWAARTGDLNLLISTQVTPQTQILFNRNIQDRITSIAPFLTLDHDPYVAVVDGKIYWIQDAYTTATTYPYSQTEESSGTSLDGVNYVRNSVKVVIDAYEGTPTFYIVDPKDPILKAYQRTFPTLFHPVDQAPASIRAHFRYPEDLFSVQASVYRAYHVKDTRVFYLREDNWALPLEQDSPGTTRALQPYYVLMRLPGETQVEYLLIQPFTPNNRQNMISWLAARNDGDHYGELALYQLPHGETIFGPQQIGNFIQENTDISSQFTLWNQSGSSVQQGNLLTVPVGTGFLYFEPVYLRATGATSIPELKKVILAYGQKVVWDDTLAGALVKLVGGSSPSPNPNPNPNPNPSPSPGTGSCVQQLLQLANQHYQAAQEKLKAGDLAGYAAEIAQVGQLIQEAQNAPPTGPCPAATSTPQPSPTPTK